MTLLLVNEISQFAQIFLMERQNFTFIHWKRNLFLFLILFGIQYANAQTCSIFYDNCPTEDIIIYDCDMDGMATIDFPMPVIMSTGNCGAPGSNQTSGPSVGDVRGIGTYTIIFSASAVDTDNFATVTASCSFNVIIRADDEAPVIDNCGSCLLYTSPSPRDATLSRMPSSA